MKKLTIVMLMLLAAFNAGAQERRNDWNYISPEGIVSKDSITRGEYTLIFINKKEGFSDALKTRMIETFFTVYPLQAKTYNPNTRKKVTFLVDPTYEGVAATAGSIIRYNPGWFDKHPGDIDVVTHEAMHIVQSYRRGGPGWVTEGIADYVRHTMGVDNPGAGWTLTPFSDKQNYDNAYRITARFFVWIEKNVKPGFVVQLNEAMREGKYNDGIWKEWTGKDVKELWSAYAANPVI
jgi:hypothetical protein